MTDAARLRYLSVCSGIEAATVAWHPLGWEPAAFSEIEAFPRAVLAHHYPTVPLHGDFTTIEGHEYGAIDVLVGGTPCQDFSVAGLRAGIAGDRGNLTLEFLRLAARTKPRWIVWENVPGVLSSDDGRALGAFLGGLAELGYGFGYRVLDAQYFNLAQRRARIFVVGYLGDWRRAAAVLFERESLLGNPPPRREAGKVAPTIPSRSSAGGGLGTDFDCDGGLIANTLSAARGAACANAADLETYIPVLEDGRVAPTLVANGNRTGGIRPPGTDGDTVTSLIPVVMSSGQANAEVITDGGAPTLTCLHEAPIVAMSVDLQNVALGGDLVGTLDTTRPGRGGGQAVIAAVAFEWQRGATQNLDMLEEMSPALIKSQTPAIAFSVKDHGADAGDISPTLRAGGHDKSHANGGVMPAVAFTQNSRSEVRQINGDGSIVGALAAEPGAQQQAYVAYSIMPMNSGKDYKARETDVAQPIMAGGPVGGNQGGDFIAQPLPFDTTQITSKANYSNPQPGDPSHPLAAGAHAPAVAFNLRGREEGSQFEGPHDTANIRAASGGSSRSYVAQAVGFDTYNQSTGDINQTLQRGTGTDQIGAIIASTAVRRLTPRECERLQGFPEIHRKVTLRICGNEEEKRALASCAEPHSAARNRAQSEPVAVHVLIDLERSGVQLLRAGRLIWSASDAGSPSASPLSMPLAGFVRLAAATTTIAVPQIHGGGAASPLNINASTPLWSGSAFVPVSGHAIRELAEDAAKLAAEAMRSTTLQPGSHTQPDASILETSSCCVVAAISSSIREQIQSGISFSVSIETHAGYTAVQYRNKPAADGNRYKALGNSMAVPVMAWIGQRIAMVEALT